MGGLFGGGSKAPIQQPIAAQAITEAVAPKDENAEDTPVNKKRMGKRKLQIPSQTTSTATTGTGLGTGV